VLTYNRDGLWTACGEFLKLLDKVDAASWEQVRQGLIQLDVAAGILRYKRPAEYPTAPPWMHDGTLFGVADPELWPGSPIPTKFMKRTAIDRVKNLQRWIDGGLPKGEPGRRPEFSLEALSFAHDLRKKKPEMKMAEIRGECARRFGSNAVPRLNSFRQWLGRRRKKR